MAVSSLCFEAHIGNATCRSILRGIAGGTLEWEGGIYHGRLVMQRHDSGGSTQVDREADTNRG